jgi:MFS family permease
VRWKITLAKWSPAAAQALVASVSEDMRGRYMAVSGVSWMLPFAVGPYLAGLIIDGPKPYLLWYAAGFVGLLSTFAFLALYRIRIKQEQKVKTMPEVVAL